MRPIHLRFSGLQSYREPQEIDFQRLTEVGLFGIFGPTGSGKSTILDAITLALYGRVERAGGGIQGIMNMNSDQLNVSFAFALGERLFRAERSYRRNKADLINLTGARLIEVRDDEHRVLADKDVAGAVKVLIGLDVQDFTRAVVLPQGKFAEFLTLSGKERRDMLERLFGLSAYGRQLTERVRARLAQTSSELGQIIAGQEALGDASEEAVRDAEKKQEAACQAAIRAEKNLKEATAVLEEGQKLIELHKELDGVLEKQQQHQAISPAMEAKDAELAQSERAEPLRHILEDCKAARVQLVEAKERACEAENRALELESKAQKAKEAAQEAKDQLEAQEPAMLLRKRELEGAIELEKQLDAQKVETRDLAQELSRLEGAASRLQGTLMASRQRRATLEEEVAALEQARSQKTISAQERQRLSEASISLEKLKLQEKLLSQANEKYQGLLGEFRKDTAALEEARAELAAAQKTHQDLEAKYGQHAQSSPATQEELVIRGEELSAKTATVNSLLRLVRERTELGLQKEKACQTQAQNAKHKSQLEEQVASASQKLAELKEAKEQEEQAKLAARLAHGLRQGEPCPVCGSKDHPRIQHAGEFHDWSPSIAEAEGELENLRTQLIKAQTESEALADRIDELDKRLAQQSEDIAAEKVKLPSLWCECSESVLEEKLAEEERIYSELKKLSASWQKEQASLQKALTEAAGEQTSWEKKEAALAAKARTIGDNLKQAQGELKKAQDHLFKARREFSALAGELSQRELEARLLEIASWDRQLEQLQKQEQARAQELNLVRKQVEETSLQLEESKLTVAKVQAQKLELDKKQAQLQKQLQSLTEGAPAADLLSKLAEARNQLHQQTAALNQRAEELQKELAKTQGELERSLEALSGAQRRSQSLEQALQRGLLDSEFASREELAASLRSAEERQKLRGELEAYRQQEKLLDQELTRLKGQIQGRAISKEEWDQRQRLYQEAKQLSQEALAQRGAASENYRQLEARHKKWQELEELRVDLAQKTERLETLQSVFRGNVFVDFLAEEQLAAIAQDASSRLGQLSGGHYALEIGEDCNFQIIDHFSGSIRRSVNTLSGGETFLASLSLALALSSHIQLRGTYPLEFFFLDEGFGTLDPELLETVITALETLQQERMVIGVISHVPELRQRLARRIYVEPAEPLGRGSRVHLEVG
jgi:exonuclease SbcC